MGFLEAIWSNSKVQVLRSQLAARLAMKLDPTAALGHVAQSLEFWRCPRMGIPQLLWAPIPMFQYLRGGKKGFVLLQVEIKG